MQLYKPEPVNPVIYQSSFRQSTTFGEEKKKRHQFFAFGLQK
jgi:hypothetical protein